MPEDIDFDGQTLNTSEQPHWYWRLWTCCLGYGCLDYQVDEYPVYLIPYEPVGQFQKAASMGDLSTVEHFITSRRYHVDKYDRRNRTSLHYACAHNHPEVVMLLIKSNCTINAQDDEGCTPLIKATERNNLECVSILLKHGADPHMADFTGNTALHYAVYNGNRAIASELLKYKVDINAITKHGFTPFSLAVFEKREKMAEFLTERGADVHEVIESNSEETSFKQPEQRSKKHIRFNEEVHYNTGLKPCCSELRPPEQLKSILKKPDQISTEVDNNMEEKSLSRLPDKPDPDIPGPTTENNDSISIIKKVSKDPEININNTECISIKTSSRFLHQSKLVRRVENRVRKLLGRHEVNVCSQGEPLPITSEGKTPIKNLSTDSAIEMLDRESVPLRLPPEDNSDDMLLVQKNTQGDNPIQKETPKLVCRLSRKTEVNVTLEEKILPSTSEGKTYSMYLKERLKERMKEGTENSESDTSDEEPFPSTSAGRTHSMRTSLQQKVKKKYGDDHDGFPSHSEESLMQTDEGRQSDSHCMPLNKFIKEELKEAFCEIFERNKYDTSLKKELPHVSKERKQLRKIPKEQQLKNKYDSKSRQPGEQVSAKTAKEVECVHLKEIDKKDFKVKICEVLEQQENNVCPKEEGIHHIFKGKTRVKKVSQEQEMEKEYNVGYASFWSQPSMRTDEATVGEQNLLQHKHLKVHFQKDLKEMVREQFENSEVLLYPKEEKPPDDSRGVRHIKVEEKKTGYLYVPHFSSFEHRLAALRATAHIEPAPAACPGGAGDMGDMDKAQKSELALPLALALQTEHPGGQQQIKPEPVPEYCSDEITDPDHNVDFALNSCLLAPGKGDRLSTDPESAPLCGPCDMEDPGNDADPDAHAAHSNDHFTQSMNTNTRPAPACGRGDTTDHDNGTDLGSALPVVVD
ncbi:POTE ankyrin domain family member J-like isoform X7 [Rattus norvegicus]|uniref:POTE ankyrin domain family member J-like isoform X7 n=1 Tax=Rattus norvegicus TaxID=10116 RepID=UPI002FD7A5D6